MSLKLVRLEERLLFDASAVAAVAQVVAEGQGDQGDAQASEALENQALAGESVDTDAQDGQGEAVDMAENEAPPVNVLLVSSRVEGSEQLASFAADGVTVIQYDADNMSLAEIHQLISDSLDGQLADSIGFATHGQTGMFHLTKDVYVAEYSLADSPELQQFWRDMGNLLAEDGRVDLLGCNVGTEGEALLANLDVLLDSSGKDIDIAASTDMTGNEEGSNWALEVGEIDAGFYFSSAELAQWEGNLATFTVTTTADAGAGSLRAAIISANGTAGIDTIDFSPGALGPNPVISLTTVLPALTETVIIDGMTGWTFGTDMVTVDGSGIASAARAGFVFSNSVAGSSELSGLVIRDFNLAINTGLNTGLDIHHNVIVDNITTPGGNIGILMAGSGHDIHDNYIGVEMDGDTVASNEWGIFALLGATGNTIRDNVISGNTITGISFNNLFGGGPDSNFITDNLIGTDATGLLARGNGVGIAFIGASNTNTISGNTISGNTSYGFSITSSDGNIVTGNNIGVGVDGVTPLGNGIDGLLLDTVTGGSVTLNTIAANTGNGIMLDTVSSLSVTDNYVGINAAGAAGLGNGADGINLLSSTLNDIADNIISSNADDGLFLFGSSENTISRNFIGTDPTGMIDRGNSDNGVTIRNNSNENELDSNLISGNNDHGIRIQNNSDENVLTRNIIGLNATESATLQNNDEGVFITSNSSDGNIIGDASDMSLGNIISGNGDWGIRIRNADQNIITGNYIGTDSSGTLSFGNADGGISLENNSNGNFIGVFNPGAGLTGFRNIISANLGPGIVLNNSTDNNIHGNLIGTNDSRDALGNEDYGIRIISSTGTNFIGLENVSGEPGNSIAATTGIGVGIQVDAGVAAQEIRANFIGQTMVGDSAALGNSSHGIVLDNDATNQIGGLMTLGSTEEGNTISGNGGNGIQVNAGSSNIEGNLIGVDTLSTTDFGNIFDGIDITGGTSTMIGGAGDLRNVISGNSGIGIDVDASDGVTIDHNFIGSDITESVAIGNDGQGIFINGNAMNVIITNNTVLGNGSTGIRLDSDTGSLVTSNFVGTNSSSDPGLGNFGTGIRITNDFNTVGGDRASDGNVVSGNFFGGIEVGRSNNVVQGNYVGTDSTGTVALGNGSFGVSFGEVSSDNLLGGATSNLGNIISANDGDGITGSDFSGNTIIGNHIGTDVTGTVGLGNTGNGINFFRVTDLIIGGTGGSMNLISGNGENGIRLNGVSDSTIQGNFIGTDITGVLPIGNSGNGILIKGSDAGFVSTSNLIGGNGAGEANTIAYNGGSGVAIDGPFASGNSILRNSIFDNGDLGIKLTDDANNNITVPSLGSVIYDGFNLQVDGNFVGVDGVTYEIQFFGNFVSDPSGSGEGRFYLGSLFLVAGAGETDFAFVIGGGLPAGVESISSTQTSLDTGDTSEFSRDIFVEEYFAEPQIAPPYLWPDQPEGLSDVQLRHFYRQPYGYIDPKSLNQMTSFGSLIGFKDLVKMGDYSMQLLIKKGEPQLVNNRRGVGFGEAVDALDYTFRPYGMPNSNPETQGAIEELSASDEEVVTGWQEGVQRFFDGLLAWVNQTKESR